MGQGGPEALQITRVGVPGASNNSYRVATPGGHPGIQGSRAFNLYIFHLKAAKRRARRRARRRTRKRNGPVKQEEKQITNQQKSKRNAPQRAPGGSKMKAWSPPGRFRAPCGPQAAARKAPNGSWGRPGEPKQSIGWTPPPPAAQSSSISGSRGGPQRTLGRLWGDMFGLFPVARRGEPKT